MKSKSLKIALLSDVHLGHRKTPADEIIRSLKVALPDNETTSTLDAIFITGDLFDRFLNLPSEEVFEIHAFIAYLLRVCKRRDILLRVLEGTPSHDWKQSRLVENINVDAGIDADAKHVSELSIETVDRFGMTLMYIPDEWSSDNDDTYRQVLQLLADYGLEQVDFVLMHGAFGYQLPSHVNVPTHDPDRYADIARHYVFCGHVHKPSQYRNILVPGSFDRLAHGEEEVKGSWIIEVVEGGDDHLTFVENKTAKIYRSIDVSSLSQDEAFDRIETIVNDLPFGSHIRIVATGDDPVAATIEVLRKNYPNYQWSSKTSSTAKMGRDALTDLRATFQTQPITKDTIDAMVRDQLLDMGIDKDEIGGCMEALKEVT